jgi:erythromycin esterase
MMDLDFESASPRGFSTGGGDYRVGIDRSVAESGKQSLRMPHTADATPIAAIRASDAAGRWAAVVANLDERRAVYPTAGASDRDIEWAAQNARVVRQAMQMRANQVSRDRTMAENVKWILDQNPGAKIVLWAHNGHFATGGFSYETMGTALRRMYRRDMVVFGFAFNQGSFQAIPQRGGTLRNFTVPPAPPGSLDATLAATGLPLLALDLRAAPDWFRESRQSGQIDAVYPEDEPYAYLGSIVPVEAYDAMLFVEATTVARKNPGR